MSRLDVRVLHVPAKQVLRVAPLVGFRMLVKPEPKLRSSRHVAAGSTLTLEHADLAVIETQIDAQSDRVVQVGQRTQALLAQVWSALLASRKASVESSLRANFDFRQIHTSATEFSSAAFSVIEIEEIRGLLFNYRTSDERDIAIADARVMRERSADIHYDTYGEYCNWRATAGLIRAPRFGNLPF
jgi:hypothetical protein